MPELKEDQFIRGVHYVYMERRYSRDASWIGGAAGGTVWADRDDNLYIIKPDGTIKRGYRRDFAKAALDAQTQARAKYESAKHFVQSYEKSEAELKQPA